MPSLTPARRITAAIAALSIISTLAFAAPAIADEVPPTDATTPVEQVVEPTPVVESTPVDDTTVVDETTEAEGETGPVAARVPTEPGDDSTDGPVAPTPPSQLSPQAPADGEHLYPTDKKVTLSWVDPSRVAILRYEIQGTNVQPGAGDIVDAPFTYRSETQPYTVDDVSDGTYWWQVRAVSTAGVAGPWSVARKVIVGGPVVPTNITSCPTITPITISSLSQLDMSETRAGGSYALDTAKLSLSWHYMVPPGGERPETYYSKVAWYYPTDFALSDLGPTSLTFASTQRDGAQPGENYKISVNGAWVGNIVKEPLFPYYWTTFAIPGMASKFGYQQAYGTINEILAGLAANGVTNARVSAIGGSGGSGSAGSGWLTSQTAGCLQLTYAGLPAAPVGAPTILTPTNGSATNTTTLNASWTAVDGATYYQTRVANNQAMTDGVVGPFGPFGTTLTTTVGEGTYWFQVRAANAGGFGAWSTSSKFTTDVTKPVVLTEKQVWQSTPDSRIAVTLTFSEAIKPGTLGQGWYAASPTSWTKVYYSTRSYALTFTDLVGNQGTYALNVDASAPTVPSSLSPNGWTVASTAFSWAASTDAHNPITYEVATGSHPNLVNGPGSAMSTDFLSLGTTTNTTFPKVLPIGATFWQVRAIDSVGNVSQWSAPAGVSVIGIPVLSSTSVDPLTGDLAVSWTAVNGISGNEGYQVEYTLADGSTVVHFVTSGRTDTQVADSTNQGAVSVRVRAIYVDGFTAGYPETKNGEWSNTLTFTRDSVGPDAPTLNAPSKGSPSSTRDVTFTWSAVDGATGYQLAYASGAPGDGDLILTSPTSVLADTNERLVSSLPDDTYWWQVRAKDSLGNWGPWSVIWNVRVDTHAPNAPELTAPTDEKLLASSNVTFQWSNVESDATYELAYSASAPEGKTMIDPTIVAADTNQKLVSGLANATTYWWQVRTVDAAGNVGAWSIIWSVSIDTQAPGRVILSSPTDNRTLNPGAVTYKWQGLEDAAGYYIEVSTSPETHEDGSFSTTIVNGVTTVTANEIAATLSGTGKIYWHVLAFDSVLNRGQWSSTWSINVVAPAVTPVTPGDPAPAADPTTTTPTTPVTVAFAAPAVTPQTVAPATTTDPATTDNTTDQLPTESFNGEATSGDAPWWPWAVGIAILLILALLWFLVFRKRFGNQS